MNTDKNKISNPNGEGMRICCPECGTQSFLTARNWRCDCGGAWEFCESDQFDLSLVDREDTSIWRYAALLGLNFDAPLFRMGAGWTPLLPVELQGRQVLVKPEYFSPTGSFKDRGTEVMINILASQGVTHIAEDSSGNAGASVAAYAARAGMQAEIFVPAHASPVKQAQIRIYGANVRPIPGPRNNAKLEAIKAVEQGIILASHAYHPGFLLGQETVAWEVWEQLGQKVPDWYVIPLGQGVHLLGVWLGFRRLMQAGLTSHMPRLVGVQPELLSPICQAFAQGLDIVPGVEAGSPSIAEGLAIAAPVRGTRIIQALRETNGVCVTVDEDSIRSAQQTLAGQGMYIEPTSATVIAALPQVVKQASPEDVIVLPLTGSGLKGAPSLK